MDLNKKNYIYRYKGHVCLIVNVASKCGLTANNYKELNELYDKYAESKGKGFFNLKCKIKSSFFKYVCIFF